MTRKFSWWHLPMLCAGFCLLGVTIPACGAEESTTETVESSPPATAVAPAALPAGDQVVARIGDETITDSQLTKAAATDLKRIEAQIYAAKKKALDPMIQEKLFSAAASRAGKSVDDLIADEVDGKLASITDEETRKYYDENRRRFQGEYDGLKSRILRYMQQTARRDRMTEFTKALRKEAKVVVYLSAPKIEVVIGDAPVKGDSDAPITIVEFSDYQCPFCKRSQATLKQVQEKYPGKIRMVFKDFPLSFHARAMPAAQASRCAGEQGKYWEFHDKMFSGSGLSDDDLKRYAEELSLDTSAFDTCFTSKKYASAVSADASQGRSLGVTGTPAFFINGRFLSGAQPVGAFSEIIDDELSKADSS